MAKVVQPAGGIVTPVDPTFVQSPAVVAAVEPTIIETPIIETPTPGPDGPPQPDAPAGSVRRGRRAAETPTKARRFKVQLKDNRPFEFEAPGPHEAVAQYREKCGILATIHPFEVEELTARG